MSATVSGDEARAVGAFMLGALAASTFARDFPIAVNSVEPVVDEDGVIDYLVVITRSGIHYHLRLDWERPL